MLSVPISSSGHLILVPWLADWRYLEEHSAFNKTFDVALHLGTLVAVGAYFLRDIAAVTGQVLMLGFFMTPILYDRSLLPAPAAGWLAFNPLAVPVESVRRALTGGAVDWLALAACLGVALLLLFAANGLFRRARSHLEDFL